MARQQTQQRRGSRNSQANSVIQRGDGDELVMRGFNEHRKALEYLAGALELSMVESKYSAVVRFGACESQENVMQHSQRFYRILVDPRNLLLYTHAAVNSMDVVLRGINGCLLDHSKATGIVASLCKSISRCMELQRQKDSQAQEELLHLTTSGLVPALIRFTTATWQAVQQLNTSGNQQQQQPQQQQQSQQQQHVCNARRSTASTLVTELLALWHVILQHTLAGPRPDSSFDSALPALIGLTAAYYSKVKEARASIDTRSSNSSILLAVCNMTLTSAASVGSALAEYIVLRDWSKPQQAQDIYLTENVPELLLQLLADQVGQLHTACGGVSQAGRDTAAAGHIQQQGRQPPRFAGCAVPKSHLALLQSLAQGLECLSSSAGLKTQKIQDVVQQYSMVLSTVCDVVLARWRRALQLNSGSNSSYSTLNAGQQQLEDTYSVLSSHLLVPTVKMLIEVVLLAPPDNRLTVHVCSLNIILLLLHMADTPVPAATADAVGRQQGQEAAASCPWPPLPAAVAAGLLRPVVAQLPQSVMYCLLQTDQQQQQQQEEMKTNRLVLLHSYGSLLIAVCQSVESKHIAAVLKSHAAPDLLVTLAAVEAVIRAQACHLAPQFWKEEPQQQQQHQAESFESNSRSSSTTTSSSRFPVRDILQYPRDQAPLLLLPFALKATEALLELMQQPRQQQHWLAPSDSADANSLLCVRLFTLMVTVLTLCEAALGGVGTSAAATQSTANIRQHHRVGDVLSLASEVSYAVGSVAYHWWRAVDDTTPSEASNVLPAVLLLRARNIWSCGLCKLLPTVPSQCSNGAANDVHVPSLLADLVDSVIHAIEVLQPLATAAYPDDEAPLLASALEGVTTAAEPVLSHWLQPGCKETFTLAFGCLTKVLQQCQDLRSAIPSMASGVDSMEADASVSSVPNTQDLGTVGKLQHFADMLHHLCEVVLAAFTPRYCCSNARCMNLTKLSEWQLVCGKACVCAGCGMARYCSINCQKQHWSLHKPMCSRHPSVGVI